MSDEDDAEQASPLKADAKAVQEAVIDAVEGLDLEGEVTSVSGRFFEKAAFVTVEIRDNE